MKSLGIIFQYHCDNEITRLNLASFRRWNPGASIITIKRAVSSQEWYDTDIGLYHLYKEVKLNCERFLYVDWDTYCMLPVEEFYKNVWDEELSGVKVMRKGDNWVWFNHMECLPESLKTEAIGMVPLSGMMLTKRTLQVLSETYFKNPLRVFCELRLPIMAQSCGIKITEFKEGQRSIRYEPWNYTPIRSIVHPAKHKLEELDFDNDPIKPDYVYP